MSDAQPGTTTDTKRPSFADGLGASIDGFTYMNQHPGLWRYALWPTVLNVLLSMLVLAWLVAAAIAIIVWRASGHGDPTWWTITREVLIGVGLLVLAIGVTLAVWWFAQGILMGHFYSKLAAKVEEQLGIDPDAIREVSLRYQVIDSAVDTTLLLLVLGAFLVLQFIPVVGTIIGLVGWVYANGYILGRDVMDHPLNLRGQRRAERRAFARQHHRPVIGLGLVVFALNFVPIVGPMLQTTSVVGAVRMHRRMVPPTQRADAASDE